MSLFCKYHNCFCFVLFASRATSLCCVLLASVWHTNPWHWSGDGRQNFNWHMFWRHYYIVRHLCLQFFRDSVLSVLILKDILCVCINVLCVCEQQRGGSRVSASCWAVQQLCGWGFLPGVSRTQENKPSGGLSGMLLGEKDPCCVRVCNCLWINFQWRRCRTWKFVTTFIPWLVSTVRITIIP